MKIGILGGTGDYGEGLALRWARDSSYSIVIGSRHPEKAELKAEEYEDELRNRGTEVSIEAMENADAAASADVSVLAIPPYHVSDTVEEISERLTEGDILVSPATGMKRDEDGFHYHRPGAGSVTRVAADAAPDDVPVVGAFHSLAAGRLADLDTDLGIDTLLLADDAEAKETVRLLAESIDGIRPLDAGGIANAAEVESITPLLINIAQNNEGLHDLGVRFE